jgi:hypothetical protein
VSDRDAAEYHEASYECDPSEGCDTLADHIRELVGEVFPKVKDGRVLKTLNEGVRVVVERLLTEGRLGPLVDVPRLQGRELLASLVAEIIEAPDARLMARCVDFVMELGVMGGMSETRIAELSGVTRASASRYCVGLKNTYRAGKPAAGMKPNAAVESYRTGRMGRSSRCPRMEWGFAKTFEKHFYGRDVPAA